MLPYEKAVQGPYYCIISDSCPYKGQLNESPSPERVVGQLEGSKSTRMYIYKS